MRATRCWLRNQVATAMHQCASVWRQRQRGPPHASLHARAGARAPPAAWELRWRHVVGKELLVEELVRERAVEARKEEDDHRSDYEGVAARRVDGDLEAGGLCMRTLM